MIPFRCFILTFVFLNSLYKIFFFPILDKAAEPQSTHQEDPGSLHLSKELKLEKLWDALSDCLSELADTSDHHAVLVLQPAVEAFFLVHASEKDKKFVLKLKFYFCHIS